MRWLEKTVAVDLKIPELRTIADAQNALSTIIAATACGAILSDDAATLASIISAFVRTTEVAELETRLCALEKASVGAPMERMRHSGAGSKPSKKRARCGTPRRNS